MARRSAPDRAKSAAGNPPAFRPVQLARLVDVAPAGSGWLHEMKYDGYRLLVAVGGGEARAYTRSGLDWSGRFAPLLTAVAALDVESALIDGEAVVLDADGRSNFQALQNALRNDAGKIAYYAFDLLELDGEDLTDRPLTERKARLETIVPGRGRIRYSDHIEGSGERLFARFCKAGLEGVISKRADSRYVGARSGSWLKIKCIRRQEFVIVGWTPSDKARGFRSLMLGAHERGRLRYAGKVGTGFDAAELRRLEALMKPLARRSPTVQAPPAEVRDARWIEPRLVAEIAYAERTRKGTLRHPSYLGLREDKKVQSIEFETEEDVTMASEPAAVPISSRDRVIFPEAGVTKGDLADYYAAMAPVMLPWAGSRPISLVRCPQGRAKKCFFQKHDTGSFGEAVKHVAIEEKDGETEPYIYIDTPEGLLSCVQMGTIEFHGWGARIEDIEKPDRLVFDLDPDTGLDFAAVRAAAFRFRAILTSLGLQSFPMLTGGKGVHVIAPLVPRADWDEVKDFARRLALAAAQADPDKFTAALPKAKRKGKIFIDYLRNQRGATAVMPYSARAREGAPVAAPLTWKEMATIDKPSHFHVTDTAILLKRARSKALAGWGRAEQDLPDL
ncbi:DNA ligase [Sphingopyxis terrae subsp. terrae NBRC 15098]|uniref:DNA ligase (ATP) n=1 Tax=Sphingopyxis terrae subsp. terrae NBRC 15098 TaxID=1219058 RepID=A0A142W3R3_9SPHN|nr:DNA ligase D [Sphingopyxis terrae]AMU96609.1 DNA ligase [Sphingopyxis terrae subsp. terrae NBRC 15098]